MKHIDQIQEYVRVLTIAGSDSGGGAGIQADLKTFAALGAYGMSAITALTAQNTLGVAGIHAAPADFLAAQAIDRYGFPHVVLDPVMTSASGARLIEPPAVEALVAELFPRVSLITPNLDEAALLLGRAVDGVDDMPIAAQALLHKGARAVLLKGGHLPGEQVIDVLVERGAEPHIMQHARVDTRNLHGAGCTLSSALAVFLAQDLPLPLATEAARSYVLDALKEGAGVTTGQGVGPLNHGFAPRASVLHRPRD